MKEKGVGGEENEERQHCGKVLETQLAKNVGHVSESSHAAEVCQRKGGRNVTASDATLTPGRGPEYLHSQHLERLKQGHG